MQKRINKLVYSVWTAPSGGDILKKARNWHSPQAQLYCLALSVLKGAEHFDKVEVVTDTAGAMILKALGLPMNIKTSLDRLDDKYSDFWALGKIIAYEEQNEPFMHLDFDAVLFDGLPDYAHQADVFVQNIEDKNWFQDAYMGEVRHASKTLEYFPPLWNEVHEAYCMGIFGGHNTEFIKEYCEEAKKFVYDKRNEAGWAKITNHGSYCIVFEQYILALMCAHKGIEVTYFDKFLNKERLEQMGYLHIWGAKKSAHLTERLKKKLISLYPRQASRLIPVIEKASNG